MPDLKEQAFSKPALLKCKGYDPKFIKSTVIINADMVLNKTKKALLPKKVEGNTKRILNYTDLSVYFNAKRKVPFFAVYNIDGKGKDNKTTRPQFHQDPRIDADIQLDFAFYDLRTDITEFEIGHMASNAEMGRGKDGKLKAWQTFHFTNSVPQAEKLNTGIWKGLESYVIKEAANIKNNKRICVFTGPLLKNNDPKYVKDKSFRIPLLFFKVIIFPTTKGVYSTAFIMSHAEKMIEDGMIAAVPEALGEDEPFSDFPYKKVFQVNIDFLEKESGLKFTWKGVKKVKVPDQKNQIKKIKSIKDAKDAAKAIKDGSIESISTVRSHDKAEARIAVRKGLVPQTLLSDSDLTAKELAQKKFKLNMVLP